MEQLQACAASQRTVASVLDATWEELAALKEREKEVIIKVCHLRTQKQHWLRC